ncbi:VCBS repeat-containing protein [Pseudomonadales bacterium]|nr:VCBS repeat-containing protein [Pseudomonadales bacterium]
MPGPIAFTTIFEQQSLGRRVMIVIGDVNNDGCIEVLGTINDCEGNLLIRTDEELGLGAISSKGNNYRDARLADFNGDGYSDLVSNSYHKYGDSATRAMLHINTRSGTFEQNLDFLSHDSKGYGETIVTADFDNDGDLDVFIPYYSYESDLEQSYLLINDGLGNFTEVADATGVALRNLPARSRPEGAQAVDIDDDGDLDLFVSSQLFVNQLVNADGGAGNLSFISTNIIPEGFDEGIKFFDWDNDGDLDLLRNYPYSDIGPQLYSNELGLFSIVKDAFPSDIYRRAYGLNAADVNNDGLIDVVLSGGRTDEEGETRLHYPYLFINTGTSFEKHEYYQQHFNDTNDITGFGDFNNDGVMDMITRFATGVHSLTKLHRLTS